MKPTSPVDVSKIEFELEEGFRVKALERASERLRCEPLCFRDEEFKAREGFRIGTRILAQSPKAIEAKIKEELSLGAHSFELNPSAFDPGLFNVLDSVFSNQSSIEVRFRNRADPLSLAWAKRFTEKSSHIVSFGFDPISSYATSKDELPFGQIKTDRESLIDWGQVRLFRVDLAAWMERGASAALEVALAKETIQYLRDRHFEGDLNIEWVTATGVQSFLGVAKLRALRRAVTATGAGVPTLVSRNLESEKTSFDEMNGALRGTSSAWASIVGGADTVLLSSIDRRLSLTTLLILKEEGHLARVIDPALGSYALESLTLQIEQEAARFSERIRAEGGILSAIRSGMIEGECSSNRKWIMNRVAQGRRTIVGVNEFIDPKESLDALSSSGGLLEQEGAERYGSNYERLRKVVSDRRQKVPIFCLESENQISSRLEFVRSVLSSGGFESDLVSRSDFARLKAAPIAVVLASDEMYESDLEGAIQELRTQRVRKLILAGRPKGKEVEYARLGIDFFLYAAGDRIEILKRIFHEQGVPLENAES